MRSGGCQGDCAGEPPGVVDGGRPHDPSLREGAFRDAGFAGERSPYGQPSSGLRIARLQNDDWLCGGSRQDGVAEHACLAALPAFEVHHDCLRGRIGQHEREELGRAQVYGVADADCLAEADPCPPRMMGRVQQDVPALGEQRDGTCGDLHARHVHASDRGVDPGTVGADHTGPNRREPRPEALLDFATIRGLLAEAAGDHDDAGYVVRRAGVHDLLDAVGSDRHHGEVDPPQGTSAIERNAEIPAISPADGWIG